MNYPVDSHAGDTQHPPMGLRVKLIALLSALAMACTAPATPSTTPGTSGTPQVSASATTQAPNPSVDPTDIQLPSAASLIHEAVEGGALDPVTVLEYRASAMFGLPGLPEEFVAGVPRGDCSVGCEPPYDSHGSVPSCTMEFKLETLDTLETRAECEAGELTWTGHLVEI